ncbi:MAG: hypothetical protein KTR32_14575 [Granulosicoccus sp.]|nr:hypothetical protein [Granulosicoccus sp.]
MLPFDPSAAKKRAKKKREDKSRGKTLCGSNHHKWKVVTEQKFDVKRGKLVTVECCERCGKRRNRLT